MQRQAIDQHMNVSPVCAVVIFYVKYMLRKHSRLAFLPVWSEFTIHISTAY
jgi:hypothetical protein